MRVLTYLFICLFIFACQSKPAEKKQGCHNNNGFKKTEVGRSPSRVCQRDGFKTVKERAVYFHRQKRNHRTGRRTHKDQRVY